MDARIIEKAKRYSQRHGITLSKLVEDLLMEITSKKKLAFSDLKGIAGELPENLRVEDVKMQYLIRKHLK